MKFFRNTKKAADLIRQTIQTYGATPEHNYEWYEYTSESAKKNVFVLMENGMGLLTREGRNTCSIFVEPLAPRELYPKIIIAYAKRVFKNSNIKKIALELRAEDRQSLFAALPKNIRACRTNYTMTAPIMNLKQFDPLLPGKRFKHIRQAKHKMEREHVVKITDAKKEKKEDLLAIVKRWRKNRGTKDRAWFQRYNALIEGGFEGMTSARAISLDGTPHGFNAGWNIPNSTWYYGGVGIHDYSHPDIGLMLYLEDLEWAKRQEYPYIDAGGGESALSKFKSQFGPESWYEVHVFSITKV